MINVEDASIDDGSGLELLRELMGPDNSFGAGVIRETHYMDMAVRSSLETCEYQPDADLIQRICGILTESRHELERLSVDYDGNGDWTSLYTVPRILPPSVYIRIGKILSEFILQSAS